MSDKKKLITKEQISVILSSEKVKYITVRRCHDIGPGNFHYITVGNCAKKEKVFLSSKTSFAQKNKVYYLVISSVA